ncbi:MAG: polysaccharide biosynthesis/export family protein [Desulfobacterales bacterium]
MNKTAINGAFIIIMALTSMCFGYGRGEAAAVDSSAASAKAAGAAYTIGAGDVLRIVTWKEADFSLDTVLVRTDGKISFPLLNDVQAAGLTPMMLKDVLEKGLKNYVSAPVITVAVVNAGSQKFYILGEVTRTGEYPIVKELSVLQAFALAGGFTQWAAKDEILLIRREGGQKKVYKINYKDMAKGKNLEQDLLIRADDTVIVP